MKRLIGITMISATIICSCKPEGRSILHEHSFENDLKIHLEAIKNRNLDDLEPTIADDVAMIGPDGSKIDSKKAFMDFHKEWFKLKNWQWEGNVLKTESSDSLGHALVQYRYIQNDSLGKEVYRSDAYLILIFRNGQKGWQLIHDQNTKIGNKNL